MDILFSIIGVLTAYFAFLLYKKSSVIKETYDLSSLKNRMKDVEKMIESNSILKISIPLFPNLLEISTTFSVFNLLGSYLKLVSAFLEKSKTKNSLKIKSISLLGLMVAQRAKNIFISYFFLLFSLLMYLVFIKIYQIEVSYVGVLIVALIIISIIVNEYVAAYRIRNGYYGTNESEAREILKFIVIERDRNKPFDGYKIDEILPDPVEEDELILIGNESLEGVNR